MPPAALANDMMIYYAPQILYTEEVTMMEMICASTCLTSMICFSLEKKYRGERAFDSQVHMNNHRMGARGNATSFPLPWQDLLLQLRQTNSGSRGTQGLDLPRSGEELSNFVSVLLKTSDEGDTRESLARFVHQALVRRDVVVRLIKEMHRCGHRAYQGINLQKMEEKAMATLPERGVPPEVAKLIPYDSLLDNIRVQKQGTPTPARTTLETVQADFELQKPNGVVLEKSSHDESDINAQRIAAVQHFARKLDVEMEEEHQPDAASGTEESGDADDEEAIQRKRRITGAGKHLNVKDATKIVEERSKRRKVQRVACATGNAMIDQFEPWYFGVAFAFLFKYCTGMPDMPAFAKAPRYRRPPDAPRIEPSLWVRVMARRVEAQFSRDWSFGFVTWNYLFRSAVNLSRTIYAYDRVAGNEAEPNGLTPALLEKGAIEIMKALHGKYRDVNGREQKVNGDMTKVRWVPLSRAAQRLLQNIEHTSRRIAGTQEIRRLMRFDTNAHRIRYGVPIFVTFSPDEAHNLLMVRLSRTRRSDPVFANGKDANGRKHCGRAEPGLANDLGSFNVGVSVKDVVDSLPPHDVRRRILARDSLASVDGFRTLVLAAYEYLFGMRVCLFCPDCNNGVNSQPCQDLFGSNAMAEGGIFGRIDAGYTSVEAQKSTGSLHAHSQLFVQCLHQHTPLAEILDILKTKRSHLVRDYLVYKGHVCRQVYACTNEALKERLCELEKKWPAYVDATELISRPEYLTRRDGVPAQARAWIEAQARQWAAEYLGKEVKDVQADEAWAAEYLGNDVQALQEHKQHHVHVYNEETGLREPLQACRRKDKPELCKAEFPRTSWLVETAVVLCQGLLHKYGMAAGGRRSKLGSLHGPMNEENVNGTHPAMLAAQRFNSDVQLPYRFPITEVAHSAECSADCFKLGASDDEIVRAAQIAQDAQAGYACDYCTKRPPMAFNEVKECCKGHQELTERLRGDTTNYIGKRHAMRLMSDAYGKGIVRGQAENTNLRAYAKDSDVTFAECFRTCQTESFYGREYVDMVQRVNDKKTIERKAIFGEVDMRNRKKKKVTFRDVALLYGQRPCEDEVWYLSPYEFVTYWEAILLTYPTEKDAENSAGCHARLTECGKAKLEKCERSRDGDDSNELQAGVDYTVKEGQPGVWLPFPERPATEHFRHVWILQRRRRPRAPSFAGAPVPRHRTGEAERAALITMAYFHPWTLRAEDGSTDVVYVGNLRPLESTWQEALAAWLNGGLACKETKRYVGNFLAVHRVRPQNEDDDDDAHSSDMADDEELEVSHEDLHAALATRIGGRERRDVGGDSEDETVTRMMSHHMNSASGMGVAQHVWNCAAGGKHIPDSVTLESLKEILQAAQESQRREKSMSGAVKEAAARTETVRELTMATAKDVARWLTDIKVERNGEGKLLLNAGQYKMVEKVAARVMEELDADDRPGEGAGEPLRWMLHGGPGTGKSHVIKVVKERLFQGILKWDMGLQFQIVALQAVMADLLGGDTIHHACGIPAFKKRENHGDDLQKHMTIAKKVLQWRWLIIDEISMVSGKLLAQLDMKLREVIRDIGTQKLGNGGTRPFGGLNVLCSGDFWQLDPPDGGFLGGIPTEFIARARKYQAAPSVAHGQSLLWGGADGGIQGVTELTDCERCHDAWLREVQDEMRHGCLSENNHAFLHGARTTVPGSWTAGDVACGNRACRALGLQSQKRGNPTTRSETNYIEMKECRSCRENRESRARVANTAEDKRFLAEDFIDSPAIFANNDIKYETNKLRAKIFASKRDEAITYCPAKDSATPDALRERPDLPAQKLSWLQRHDRESGDLYGIVTLIKGMPVAVTDHIDRSPDKQLLRGKVGRIHSWVLGENETSVFEDGVRILKKLPKMVLVKFTKADGSDVDWKLPGLEERGLYPIVPKTSAWFLDKGRMHPVLKIKRRQLPLAPAFAMTSHAAQGQTFKKGAIVDLCIGKGTNPLGSYVACTRVTHRRHLLIYRPFERELFAQGEREGPLLLLKHLRGEEINWKEIEEKYMPSRKCVGCNFVQYKDAYHVGQWNRDDKICFCKNCVETKRRSGTPFRCNNCGTWKSEGSFASIYRQNWCLRTRVCENCVLRRLCRGECGLAKDEKAFTKHEWAHAGRPHDTQGTCKDCMKSCRETKVCSKCKEERPRSEYATDRQWREAASLRKCAECQSPGHKKKVCSKCKKNLPRAAYASKGQSDDQWFSSDATRKCCACRKAQAVVGMWKCVECKGTKPKEEYSKWLQGKKHGRKGPLTRCNVCFDTQESEKERIRQDSMSQAKK